MTLAGCTGGDECCTEDNKCGEDEGDCDIDADCQDGLKCGSNNCKNGGDEAADDCCYNPSPGNAYNILDLQKMNNVDVK